MWKSIKREFLLNVDNLWESAAIIGGAWVIGLIIDAIIFHFSHDDEVFIGGLIASAMSFICVALLMPAYYFSCGYEQAVSMGCTRRAFVVGMAVTTFVHTLCGMACVIVLALLESWIGRLTVPERYSIGKLAELLPELKENVLTLLILFGIMLELVCASMFLGACMQRWGRRAFWGFYIGGMSLSLFGSSVSMIDTNTFYGRILRTISQAASHIPGGVWTALAILGLPILGVVGVCLLLRGSVRQSA